MARLTPRADIRRRDRRRRVSTRCGRLGSRDDPSHPANTSDATLGPVAPAVVAHHGLPCAVRPQHAYVHSSGVFVCALTPAGAQAYREGSVRYRIFNPAFRRARWEPSRPRCGSKLGRGGAEVGQFGDLLNRLILLPLGCSSRCVCDLRTIQPDGAGRSRRSRGRRATVAEIRARTGLISRSVSGTSRMCRTWRPRDELRSPNDPGREI